MVEPEGEKVEGVEDWARAPSKTDPLLEALADKNGLDKEKLLVGHILNSIINDDLNIFYGAQLAFNSELGKESKKVFSIRLDWEINSKHTPEEIKVLLEVTKKDLEKLNWGDEKIFKKAYQTWRRDVMQKVSGAVSQNRYFKDSIDYYHQLHTGFGIPSTKSEEP